MKKQKFQLKAITDYADWLKNLPNKTPRSFRLGTALYAKKFNFDIQSSYTADEIYQNCSKIIKKNYMIKCLFWRINFGQNTKEMSQNQLINWN